MNAHALAHLERYGAFRAATAAPTSLWMDDTVVIGDLGTAADDVVQIDRWRFTIQPGADVMPGGDLKLSAILNAYSGHSTTSPKAFKFDWEILKRRFQPVEKPPTLGQSALAEIRSLSGLTIEQIAPLTGVSRRSVQAWLAGEPVSQRKETRLLDLREALRTISSGDPEATRQRLMDRKPGEVRIYDLLADGRFETAVDLALGRRAKAPPDPGEPKSEGLDVQLSRLNDRAVMHEAPSTGRFSGRLRR